MDKQDLKEIKNKLEDEKRDLEERIERYLNPVSYTHLTLPTICSV